MKKTHIIAPLLLAAALFFPTVNAQNIVPNHPIQLQGGPGIAVKVSATPGMLPQEAQKFLQTIYSRDALGPITFNAVKDTYQVEVGSGTKITFDKNGKVKDIMAPEGESLYGRAIAAVLPEKAYKHLENAGLLEDVTGIKNADSRGLRVLLLNAMPPEMLFDVDGLFIIIDD